MWGDKRYHTWNYHLRKQFGMKIFKLPLDAGFTCPNRDGTFSNIGCIYCSERGSGDYAGNVHYDIEKQYQQVKEMMHKKWPNANYIAYFQAFTNTYSDVKTLRKLYYTTLSLPGVVGISIATRPDCLPNDVLDLLEELNNTTYLWVELGLQSIHDRTAAIINRGHDFQCFLEGLNHLQSRNIRTCAHIIYGLPGESLDDMKFTAEKVALLPLQGIKFHLLQVLKNTPLENFYTQGALKLLDFETYVNLVVDTLEIIPEDMIIHRLTGDAPRSILVGPAWSQKKWEILNAIDQKLLHRSSKQGSSREDFVLRNKIQHSPIRNTN